MIQRVEISQPFLLWFIAIKEKHEVLHEFSDEIFNDEGDHDDKSKEILPILREQMKAGSAQAEETYKHVQYQLKLHKKITSEIFKSAERFLYYTGVEKFPDIENDEVEEIDNVNPENLLEVS